jgi:hypothetical protein
LAAARTRENGASWARDGILILIGCRGSSNKLPPLGVILAVEAGSAIEHHFHNDATVRFAQSLRPDRWKSPCGQKATTFVEIRPHPLIQALHFINVESCNSGTGISLRSECSLACI